MSKFIDKLNSVMRGGMPALGFRAGGAQPHPRMLLVAQVAAKAGIAGADAVILLGGKAPKPSGKAKSDVPWGGWLKEATAPAVKQLGEAGADFVVFSQDSAARAVLEAEKPGKVVAVAPELDAGLMRAADDLPVDAVLITDEKPSLSWEKLMLFRRAVNLLSKPVLVTVSPDIAASELQALCDAGVAGVVVASAELAGLRKAIDKLTPPKAAKGRSNAPALPRMGGGEVAAEEADEDED